MAEKLPVMTPASPWEVGVIVAVLIAAVVCCGEFLFSVNQVLSAGNSPNFAFAYGEGENPWAHVVIPGDAGRDPSPAVRSASLRHPAKTPAF